ncbi:MAG: HEPN domain-containing protein [Proteobacteria bacterium]|nr:HEPN domain-containing protein [Pseudomonadota bacterium]
MTPRKQEKLFRKEYAAELISIASADLSSAKILADHNGRRENSIYHAQQCVEKSLKALLCWMGIPVPLVHDAGILVAKLPSNLTPPGGYNLSDLTPYATVKRYEEGMFDITEEEHKAALDIATQVLEWTKSQLKS